MRRSEAGAHPQYRLPLRGLLLLLSAFGCAAAVTPPAEISDEECTVYKLPEILWMGAVGISGLEGVRLPGASGLRELGFNQIASVKWFMETSTNNTAMFNGSTVKFYDLGDDSKNANGDPRRALVRATEVCNDPEADKRLLGFFGGISSEESKAVQLVASTFGYTQVSPVSEGAELSDKSRYPTFNRVFTPSFKLAPAIVELIKNFGWQKIGLVAGETPEDFSAVRSFQTATKEAGIEVLTVVNAISEHSTAMEELVEYMNSDLIHIRVWVMFFTRDFVQTMRFFSYAAGTPLMGSDNVFIEGGRLADAVHSMRDYLNSSSPPEEWQFKSGPIEDVYEAMSGVLTVTQSKGAGSQANADFLAGLNQVGIQNWIGPGLGDNLPPDVREAFAREEKIDYRDLLHSTATLTYDTLDVFARAANQMIADGLACRIVGPHRDHSLFLKYVRNLQFEGVSGYLAFDENGDRVSDFAIYNLQFDASTMGKERLLSLAPERVMSWRVEPPVGERALTILPEKQVQWRDGQFGPPPKDSPPASPANSPSDDNLIGEGDQSDPPILLIVVLGSVALLLLAFIVVAAVLLNRHFAQKSGKMREGVLDGQLLEYDKRPVHSDNINIELDGTFMYREVRIHVLNNVAEVPAGAVLIRCKAPLTNCPANGLVAVHRDTAMKGCVERHVPFSDGDKKTSQNWCQASILALKEGKLAKPSESSISDASNKQLHVSHHPLRSLASMQNSSVTAAVLPPISLHTLAPRRSIVTDVVDPPNALNSQGFDTPLISDGSAELIADVESQNSARQRTTDLTSSAVSMVLNSARVKAKAAPMFRGRGSGSRSMGLRRSTVSTVDLLAMESLKHKVQRLIKLRGSRQLQPVIGLAFVGTSSQVAPAIVAEHFSGGNLHDIMHNSATPLEIDVRLQLLIDMATGLNTLHGQDPPVVHPNISPYNVFLDDDFRAVLTQYGYPAVLGAVNGGLVQYAAPEVLGGEDPSPQSDVFSWAMISIEVLDRRELYVGLAAGSVLTGVRDEWLRPIMGHEYPPGLVDLLVECTAKNPKRRPSAGEVVARLKEIMQGLKSRALANESAGSGARELLQSIFPTEVAKQLEMGKRVEPEQHPDVTIFFSDIVGFTNISASLNPGDVMEMLNRLYLALDKLTAKHGLFKVETIGDAYMAVGNLHPKAEDHTARVARFAIEAVAAASQIPVHASHPELGNVNMRVGFHVGPVVASVIGDLNPRYCLFGDTVNTASRMESTSIAGRIHLSHSAYCALMEQAPEAKCELRTDLGEIKGKGRMKTYFLENV